MQKFVPALSFALALTCGALSAGKVITQLCLRDGQFTWFSMTFTCEVRR